MVSGLQYAIITQPNIAFVVNKLSQFMHALLHSHWKVVKRVLRYLAGTISHGLTFHKSSNLCLLAFYDFDWGLDMNDRKSTNSYCIFLVSNLISWASKK